MFFIDCFFLSEDCRTITVIIPFSDDTSYKNRQKIKIQSLQVTDEGKLIAGNSIIIDGSYKTSRLIDGKIIFVSSFYAAGSYYKHSNFVPTITENDGEEKCIPIDDVFIPQQIHDSVYTIICKLDEKTLNMEGRIALLSYSGNVYVTPDNIYATSSYTQESNDGKFTIRKPMTDIVCISHSDGFENKGEITIEGYVNNRYSIDEYNGVLRVVTTTSVNKYQQRYFWSSYHKELVQDESVGTSANLYCINLDSWEVVAGVYQFAPIGERVRSVRYEGDKAYVCTAVQVTDPVFFFDLSDLSNITYKDTGNIEGFSTSLVNFGDGYLLGIGQGAEWGSLKIEIYRETETGVESVAKFEREKTTFSSNYKSYYIDRKNQLLGLGVNSYLYDENGKRFDTRTYLVLHFDRETLELEVANECLLEGSYITARGVYIDGYFYMFGNNDYKSVKLDLK